jgi:hypothetical protein
VPLRPPSLRATLGDVDSSNLHPEQVERLVAAVGRQRDYLDALAKRMGQRKFPVDDPAYREVIEAYEGVSNLCVVAARYRRTDPTDLPPADGNSVMQQKPSAG